MRNGAVLLLVLLLPPIIPALFFFYAMRNLRRERRWLVWAVLAALAGGLALVWNMLMQGEPNGGYGPEFAAGVFLVYCAGPLMAGAVLGILVGYLARP